MKIIEMQGNSFAAERFVNAGPIHQTKQGDAEFDPYFPFYFEIWLDQGGIHAKFKTLDSARIAKRDLIEKIKS